MNKLLVFILILLIPFCVFAGGSMDLTDGDNDYMVPAATPSGMGQIENDSFTICVWQYPESMGEGNLGTIFDYFHVGAAGGGFAFLLRGSDDPGTQRTFQLVVQCDSTHGPSSRGGTSAQDFNLNEWSFICARWDYTAETAAFTELFINGVEISSYALQSVHDCTDAGSVNSSDIPRVGNRWDSTIRDYDGQLAHIMIWTELLSADDMVAVMHCVDAHPQNLLHWWPLMDSNNQQDRIANDDLTNTGAAESSNGPPTSFCSVGTGGN